MFYIVVFRSKTHTYAFNSLLKSYRIFSEVIETPRQANVSCGLSVKIPFSALNLAKSILYRRTFSSYVGIFEVTPYGNGINKVVQVA